MNNWRTQYSALAVVSNPGCPVKKQYAGSYDEKGHVQLREVGRVNLYDEIQSHAESCDIHVIMARFKNGDVDALSQRQGFFGDILNMPKTYAEALNNMLDLERNFYQLPTEVRERFGNSFSQFLASSNNPDFFEKLGAKMKAKDDEEKAKPAEPKPEDVKE